MPWWIQVRSNSDFHENFTVYVNIGAVINSTEEHILADEGASHLI